MLRSFVLVAATCSAWLRFHSAESLTEPPLNILNILLVHDSRYPIYGDYGTIVLDYIEFRQSLLAPLTNGDKFTLNYSSIAVPSSDADGAFQNLCKAFKQPVAIGLLHVPDLILDLTVIPLASATVKSFAKFVEVPSASLLCCTKSEKIQDIFDDRDALNHIVFDPPSKLWIKSIRDFVDKEQMFSAVVVMDASFELEKNHRVLLSNLPCKHLITPLNFDDTLAIRNFTNQMKDKGLQNIFIVSSAANAGRLLEEAYALDMLTVNRRPNFFVLTKDSGVVECPQCREGRVMTLKPRYLNKILRDDVLSFVRKSGSALVHEDDYRELDLLYVFDGIRVVVTALLLSEVTPALSTRLPVLSCDRGASIDSATEWSTRDTSEVMENRPHGPAGEEKNRGRRSFSWFFRVANLTGVLGSIIPGNGNNTAVEAKLDVEEQTISYDKINITNYIGTWSHMDGLKDTEGRFPRAVTNKRIRVAILVETPFIMRNTNTSEAPYRGYLIDLIQKISNELQFEYELYEVPDRQFGAVDNNGEWNGLIRELIDKKADIGLAPLSVMAERENVVDFTVPYFDLVGVTILMKKNNPEQSLFKFVTVLEPPVWGSIFGAYLLTSLLMFAFDRFSPYSYRNDQGKEIAAETGKDESPGMTKAKIEEKLEEALLNPNVEYGTRVFTLKESLWFCMTSLTPQGGGEAPRNLSGRLVAATWWMFGFIIIASYTANLAAFLTVSRLETQVASLDDLTKQYGIRYAPVENSATETYFKRMWKIEEKFYEIWRDMSLNESMSDKERAELAVWDYPVSDKYTKLWLTMKDFARPRTTEEGVAWVKATNATPSGDKDGFALIGDSAILQYKANLDCELTLVGEEFSRKPYALAVQEGSGLRDQLSGVILKLLNQRELEMMKEEWWQTKNQKSCPNSEDENEGISIQNIGGVFILVLAGTVLAAIMLAFEYYWYKRRGQTKAPSGTATTKQVIEMAATSAGRHGDNYEANYNTDYNTRFHNVFSDSKNEEANKEFRRGNHVICNHNHAYEPDKNNEDRGQSGKEERKDNN